MMIAVTLRTNLRNIARVTVVPVSVIYSHVTMEIAYREYTFATATTIVLITAMKITDTNATTENATKKTSSLAKLTKNGVELNVYRENGCAMAIQIA